MADESLVVSEAFVKYLELFRELLHARSQGVEDSEEDNILDAMDEPWWQMSAFERDLINKLPGEELALGPSEIATLYGFILPK